MMEHVMILVLFLIKMVQIGVHLGHTLWPETKESTGTVDGW